MQMFLSSESAVQIDAVDAAPAKRWMQLAHTGILRPALIVIAGESATCPQDLTINAESILVVRHAAAHGELSSDGAELFVLLVDDAGQEHTVCRLPICSGPRGMLPRTNRFDLSPWAGLHCRVRLRCGAGPDHDPCGDWIAILDLAVGTEE